MKIAMKPVTIVTGFLGSGKTTLLNRILSENHGKKIAVILNEIGDVNLDSEMVVQSIGEDLKIMNNGCICCTVRGDLSQIAQDLIAKNVHFDAMIIETTGLADPTPVAQTFFMDEALASQFKLDAIVTVVDAFHIHKNLEEIKETQEQIGFADVILLNKCDLITPDQLVALRSKLTGMNGIARIVETTHCAAPIADIFGIGAFDLDSRMQLHPALNKEFHDHSHDDDIQSIYVEDSHPMSMDKLDRFFSLVMEELGGQILRSKGVVFAAGEDNRILFQGVHTHLNSTHDRPWEPDEVRNTKMVFIGRYIPKDVLQEGLELCRA